jgi:hypothetical protein
MPFPRASAPFFFIAGYFSFRFEKKRKRTNDRMIK